MKTYKITNIIWETDGIKAKELSLPQEECITVDDHFDIEECGADYLSNKYGWLVSRRVVSGQG